MNLAARLAVLEARRPASRAPTPLTEAQWDKLANKLIRDYGSLGRDRFIVKLAPVVGAETATRTADAIEALAARAQARWET